MVGKLTRSLSGAHVSPYMSSATMLYTYHDNCCIQTASPADSKLNSFLHDLANGPDDKGKQLLDRSVVSWLCMMKLCILVMCVCMCVHVHVQFA